jgi:Fe-S oxidoreductase
VSIKHWQEFEDVADHCTVCHKCLSPCPVKIDFGDVSMNMRNLLRKMGKKTFRPGNAAAMFMLNATNPETIKLARAGMALGLAGLFLEAHPDPSKALCDGPSALKLSQLKPFLEQVKAVDDLIKSLPELDTH